MKLTVLGSLVLMVAAASSTACGPGLSHRAKAPSDDVFQKLDAELANAIGETTLTGAELPTSRMPVDRMPVGREEAAPSTDASEAESAVPVVQTWATPAPTELPADLMNRY